MMIGGTRGCNVLSLFNSGEVDEPLSRPITEPLWYGKSDAHQVRIGSVGQALDGAQCLLFRHNIVVGKAGGDTFHMDTASEPKKGRKPLRL